MVIAPVHDAHRSLPQELDGVKLVPPSTGIETGKSEEVCEDHGGKSNIPVHCFDYGSDGK